MTPHTRYHMFVTGLTLRGEEAVHDTTPIEVIFLDFDYKESVVNLRPQPRRFQCCRIAFDNVTMKEPKNESSYTNSKPCSLWKNRNFRDI